jgi:hypothetical protein
MGDVVLQLSQASAPRSDEQQLRTPKATYVVHNDVAKCDESLNEWGQYMSIYQQQYGN